MDIISVYLLFGIAAGLLAGLLGVGGGIVIVPGLVYIFSRQGFPIDSLMHSAIGTSLATIVFTSISSTYSHHKKATVLWEVVKVFAPGLLLGSLLGAVIADFIGGAMLMMIFGVVLCILAIQMMFDIKPAAASSLPSSEVLTLVGTVIGSLSVLVGIGGGSMTVPFLVWRKVSIRNAIATAAACGFPLAFAGMLGFIITGWGDSHLPPLSTGYVNWPACLGIVSTSMIFAVVGAKLAHFLPVKTVKRLFSIFLVVMGVRIFLTGLGS